MSDDALQRGIDAGGGLLGSGPAIKIDFSVPEEPSATDRPYTDETLQLVAQRLADERGVDPEFAARRLLDDLLKAGLLITPRIQQDTEWLGRAYIWRRPDGKPVVLNPMDVDVVLPQEPT